MFLQAPSGTQLEVPIPEVTTETSNGTVATQAKKKYQIHLKSSEGQIYVLLVNKDSDSEQPLVVQVLN